MSEPADTNATPSVINEQRELRIALALTAIVLATLTAVKPLGSIRVLGTVGYTIAALLQLYLPIWRADRLGVPLSTFGLHLQTWKRDLSLVAVLIGITFPLYAVAHHFYLTTAREALQSLGWIEIARYVPHRHLAPHWPVGVWAWLAASGALLQLVLTHTLGVALPEEAFYRGYLQPRLETRWIPRHAVFGARMGSAVVITAALFALGHFLGEWNPLRLGPIFPALIFAWLRNSTGSIAGAVAYHAACNVFGEILFGLYNSTS